ncbi:TVP38/TMEM64 family protein [Oscillatoria sp. FACHB-1407]|uniref:TVP38/TMEM64 family protein n=1 Tax=Oscillatoria sp. FACHB-1407 TaxID=2692847 RepID=UPI001685C562|nr:TVP38/TMEM64 family protein [Oscillatoria sp. FACHB-1407]MBD2460616.1 TVP38/TMEM64 family protein [Oscillatoria sp. FACHB-1407]
MNWLRRKRFWVLVLGVALLVGLGSTIPLEQWFLAVKNWLAPLDLVAIPVFILLYLIATVLGLPNILLILVAGTLFGMVNGIIAVSIADTLGAIACFLIGRGVARQRIKKWLSNHPTLAQLDHAVGQKGWKILLLTRLSPLVPSNVLNYGFSCTRVNFWQYCFFSWLGMLPVIALYVYLGSFGASLLSSEVTPGKIALQLAGLLLAIGAALYTTRLTRKALAPPCPANSTEEVTDVEEPERSPQSSTKS